MKTLLVTGGAGYIGSHMVARLLRNDYQVIVVDNLGNGHRDAVSGDIFYQGDVGDAGFMDDVFSRHEIEAVLHFAAFISVGESMRNPEVYYRNNVTATLNLLDSMVRHQIGYFIFSSSAAVYGDPRYVPVDEEHPLDPVNPYGESKLKVEQKLADYDQQHGIKSVSFRYFNAAGAEPDGTRGERHEPETHLIPLVLQAASGRRKSVDIYGVDYDTPDGTCIRDYIHVCDLCDAHLLGLQSLQQHGRSRIYNLGNGNGYSVRDVISAAEAVTGKQLAVVESARRSGDPARLVADSSRAQQELGWQNRRGNLHTIIADAWRWEHRLAAMAPGSSRQP